MASLWVLSACTMAPHVTVAPDQKQQKNANLSEKEYFVIGLLMFTLLASDAAQLIHVFMWFCSYQYCYCFTWKLFLPLLRKLYLGHVFSWTMSDFFLNFWTCTRLAQHSFLWYESRETESILAVHIIALSLARPERLCVLVLSPLCLLWWSRSRLL